MISDRLLKIEEINSVPCLCIDNEQSGFYEFDEDSIHLKLFVRNITKGIIDIKDVSNIEFHIPQSDRNVILHLAKGCLEFPTLLPNQDKQLDFCANAHADKPLITSYHDLIKKFKYKLNLVGNIDIMLNYSGSEQIYCETVKICCAVNLSLTNTISLSENGGKLTRSDYVIKRTENV